jgi:hypothetical protein
MNEDQMEKFQDRLVIIGWESGRRHRAFDAALRPLWLLKRIKGCLKEQNHERCERQ